jgi:hypothetical protein
MLRTIFGRTAIVGKAECNDVIKRFMIYTYHSELITWSLQGGTTGTTEEGSK